MRVLLSVVVAAVVVVRHAGVRVADGLAPLVAEEDNGCAIERAVDTIVLFEGVAERAVGCDLDALMKRGLKSSRGQISNLV